MQHALHVYALIGHIGLYVRNMQNYNYVHNGCLVPYCLILLEIIILICCLLLILSLNAASVVCYMHVLDQCVVLKYSNSYAFLLKINKTMGPSDPSFRILIVLCNGKPSLIDNATACTSASSGSSRVCRMPALNCNAGHIAVPAVH